MRLGPALLLVALLLLSPPPFHLHLTTITTTFITFAEATAANNHNYLHENKSTPGARIAAGGRKNNLFDDHPSTTSNLQKNIGKDVFTNSLDHYDDSVAYQNSTSLGKRMLLLVFKKTSRKIFFPQIFVTVQL